MDYVGKKNKPSKMACDPESFDGYNFQKQHEITKFKDELVMVNGTVEANVSGGCPGSPRCTLSIHDSMRNQACGL